MDPLEKRKIAASMRVASALEAIEEAQVLLGRGAEQLCAVKGLAAEWRQVGALYDDVMNTWHVISDKAGRLHRQGRLVLDHEPNSEGR